MAAAPCRRRTGRWLLVTAALLLPLTAALTAGVTQQLEARDHRLVPYTELRPSLHTFSSDGVTNFSEILFDTQKYQMIVGARDYLFRLSVRDLQELESAHWPPPQSNASMCEIKGQPPEDCHNFIRVLHNKGDKLLACGTSAFHPQCSWRSMDSLRTVFSSQSGIALCPYSPHVSVTSLLTSEGDILAATPTDFSGLDPALYRRAGDRPMLRTSRYDGRLLSSPQFVGAFETGDFAYFIFREDAVEYGSCGKRVYSRIGRVCKNDEGDRSGEWTTFLKARLNCSVPGEYPFYLDHVQSTHYVEREEVLYATFTTPDNGLAGSAVCTFNLSAIESAFEGPLRHPRRPGDAVARQPAELEQFRCRSPDRAAGRRLVSLPPLPLVHQAVLPSRAAPLLLADGLRLTRIATDVIMTKHHLAVHVLFVADKAGVIRKLSVVPRSQKTCLVEILRPFDRPTRILTMKLLKEEGSLYLGTDSGLVRVPVQRCGRYLTEDSCLAAVDPYCGWDTARGVCSRPPGRNPDVSSWRQLVTQCPDLSRPVDGGWGRWSDWSQCGQLPAGAADGGTCLCRRRACSSPAPANGGAPCRGLDAEVANCTRHGGWTGWSAWSACSQSCGVAIKSRRRSCTNPAPAHGGRPCVGEESQEIMCHSNPPCPSKASLPLDGGWGGWGGWSACSARCGGGFRRRRRQCDSPRPRNGGRECVGCAVEYGECGSQACAPQRRFTDWTPWLAANGSDGGRQLRFRFACRAPVEDAELIRLGAPRTEERVCSAVGVCSPVTPRGPGWSDWSRWSACSRPCGGGTQARSRVCQGDDAFCPGPRRMEQECNTFSCAGQWACWSEWSSCSRTCGTGHRSRSRVCRNEASSDEGAICDGAATSRESCEMASCISSTGWGEWTVWSLCDDNGEQHRLRRCKTSGLCQGHGRETRPCVHSSDGLVQLASIGPSSGLSVGLLALGCVLSFLAGALLAAGATYYCLVVRRRRQPDRPAKLFDGGQRTKLAASNTYVRVPGGRGAGEPAERGRGTLLEGADGLTAGLPSARPLPPPPPPPPAPPPHGTVKSTASIRRSGGHRYDPVSTEELRLDLNSDAIY